MLNRFLTLTVFFIGLSMPFSSHAYDILEEPTDPKAEKLPPMNDVDPYEGYNRAIYRFNVGFNDIIGEPVATSYNDYVPSPLKTGISNFFNNLKEPLNITNAFLQGKGEAGFSSLMRLSLNTTLGFFGLIDIATPAGLQYQKEDLGQTLYTWGFWTESNFIMMPIIGPYTTRELVGGSVDAAYNPTYPYLIKTDLAGKVGLFIGEKFVDYTKIVHLTDEMKAQPDPYIFMRESYLQYRTNLIYDGNPPQPDLDDFDFE